MAEPNTVELRGKAVSVTPLQSAALWLAGLSRWRRYLAAFLLGALGATALPHVELVRALPAMNMTPVLLIAFPGLIWLADGNAGWRAAFGLGWSFGFGFFLVGLYWIAAALFVDIAAFWWLVPIAVMGIPAGLSIFTGAVSQRTERRPASRDAVSAAACGHRAHSGFIRLSLRSFRSSGRIF